MFPLGGFAHTHKCPQNVPEHGMGQHNPGEPTLCTFPATAFLLWTMLTPKTQFPWSPWTPGSSLPQNLQSPHLYTFHCFLPTLETSHLHSLERSSFLTTHPPACLILDTTMCPIPLPLTVTVNREPSVPGPWSLTCTVCLGPTPSPPCITRFPAVVRAHGN